MNLPFIDANGDMDHALQTEIQQYMISKFPHEACGLIVDGAFVPIENIHPDPALHFEMPGETLALYPNAQAAIHSHTNGRIEPTIADMESQISCGLPFGLMTCNEEAATKIYLWGDQLTPPPLIGRQFRSGPSGTDNKGDCYAIIRDYYRLEKNIMLAEFPRDFKWWSNPDANDKNMYLEGFAKAGFVEISQSEIEPGDVILMRVASPTKQPNHGAVYIGNNQILHHVQDRLSRRDLVNSFLKMSTHYLRYNG